MRTDTRVWYLFQSVGRPAETKVGQDLIRNIPKLWAEWLLGCYMGAKIRVVLARCESDLYESKRNADQQTLMDELDQILGGTPESEKCQNCLNEPCLCNPLP